MTIVSWIKKNLWKIENIFWDLNTFTFFLFFFSPIVKTDPKLPSRPTTKSGNRKGNPKIQNQNNSKLPTVSILNSKIDGIDGKQECLEKFLLEHVCGINIVDSWHDLFPFISFVFSTNLKKTNPYVLYEFIPVSRIKKRY